MCAAQKAGFAVTERKNPNPSWRAAYPGRDNTVSTARGPACGHPALWSADPARTSGTTEAASSHRHAVTMSTSPPLAS
jgi:hypothetical protein